MTVNHGSSPSVSLEICWNITRALEQLHALDVYPKSAGIACGDTGHGLVKRLAQIMKTTMIRAMRDISGCDSSLDIESCSQVKHLISYHNRGLFPR